MSSEHGAVSDGKADWGDVAVLGVPNGSTEFARYEEADGGGGGASTATWLFVSN